MIYLRIAEYISEEVAALKLGKTLFVNQAPNEPLTLALIRDNPGGIQIDGEMRTERRGSFQFVVRSDKYQSAIEIAQQVSDVLSLMDVVLEEYLIKCIRPTHEPISYQLSESNLYETSVNFSIEYGIVQV